MMAKAEPEARRDALTFFLMGSGGDGVITAGDLLARAAAHDGSSCHLTKSFGPQIRGGESAVWLQLASRPVRASADAADVVVILSWRSFPLFKAQFRLAEGALVFHDEQEAKDAPPLVDIAGNPVTPIAVPLRQIAERDAGTHLARNTVVVGFLAGLADIPTETVAPALERRLGKRGPAVVEGNVKAFLSGQALATNEFAAYRRPLRRGDGRARLLMTGNDAVALGALFSGVEFFAGYPITPASEILSNLAAQMPGNGGTIIQAEDEIASMSMVVGASFGGKKSMTATSGPGLSLKAEALGFAAHAEIPCVIANVQRGGPSTGMPTMTEQSDIQLGIYGAHGDAPRVVIAPEDVKTCFDATVKAFYLTEKYQIPVIIMSDQQIGHREEALPPDGFDEGNAFRKVVRRLAPTPEQKETYKRYALGDDPVTPMSVPGMQGFEYRTSGIVHREDGSPISSPAMHQKMSEKREKKMALILSEMGGYRIVGPEDARQGIISWGSTGGAAVEAAEALTEAGRPTSVLIVELLSPLPAEAIRAYVRGLERVAVAELSFSGQFARLLRGEGVPLEGAALVHRAGGAPITTSEVLRHLKEAWG